MIERSTSFQRALEREALRYAGSLAVVAYYAGSRPHSCEAQATGERLSHTKATEQQIRQLVQGNDLELPPGASYWRVIDNSGNVVMQGGLNGA